MANAKLSWILRWLWSWRRSWFWFWFWLSWSRFGNRFGNWRSWKILGRILDVDFGVFWRDSDGNWGWSRFWLSKVSISVDNIFGENFNGDARGNQLLIRTSGHELRCERHGFGSCALVRETVRRSDDTGKKRRRDRFVENIVFVFNGVSERTNHLRDGRSFRIAPFDIAKVASDASGNIDRSCIVHDATIFRQSGVKIADFGNIQRYNKVNIVVAMRELHIALIDSGLVWRNKYFYIITIDFVTKMIGLLFVEGNNKILQTISVCFESFFWLEKFDSIWDSAGENSGGALTDFVEHKSKTESRRKFVYARIF